MGDGYVASDFQEGALFDQNVTEGINDFFSVEPYKSYRGYFTVYKQATYSTDSGATQTDKNITKNTALSTALMVDLQFLLIKMRSCVCQNDTGALIARLKKMLIVVIINENRYAGTTYMWSDGSAIALCPVSRSSTEGSKYQNVIAHEAGGHGFGRLGDEYITNTNKTLPADSKNEVLEWSRYGFYSNWTLTSDL